MDEQNLPLSPADGADAAPLPPVQDGAPDAPAAPQAPAPFASDASPADPALDTDPAPAADAPDPRGTMRTLRRTMSRVGWGMLLYVLVSQGLSLLFALPQYFLAPLLPELGWTLYTTVMSEICAYVLGPLALWLVIRKLPKGTAPGVPLRVRGWLRIFVLAMGALFAFSILTSIVMLVVNGLSGQSTGNLLETMADAMPAPVYLVLVAVVAPLGEEFLFRRLLLDRLRPLGDAAAILISGLCFGLFHLNLYQFFYATALGILFAAVIVKTGNLWHTIALHAAVNLSSTLLSYLAQLGAAGLWTYVFVMLCCVGLGILILVRYLPTYHCTAPQAPVTGRKVAKAAFSSVGALTALVLMAVISVVIIFVA